MIRSAAHLSLVAALWLWGGPVAHAGPMVPFSNGFGTGTIVIKTSERRLYFVLGDRTAVQYPVAVGRAGEAVGGASPNQR